MKKFINTSNCFKLILKEGYFKEGDLLKLDLSGREVIVVKVPELTLKQRFLKFIGRNVTKEQGVYVKLIENLEVEYNHFKFLKKYNL